MSNIEKVKVQMFKAYTWYKYLENSDEELARERTQQALAIDMLYEDCFGHELLGLWQEMNDDTRQEVALESLCDEEVLALMGYLQVRVGCRS